MSTPFNPSGYPVNQVIDGNLTLVDVYGNGQNGRLTAPNGIATVWPSGNADIDTANINAGLANGGTVLLASATLDNPYLVNKPITPTSGSRLWGAQWWSASNNDDYSAGIGASGGSVIFAVNFSGAAIIDMTNPTGTQYYGVDLAGFTIEGFATGGSGAHGILVDGAWGAGFIRGVCVHRPDQNCVTFRVNATSGKIPDEWKVSDCKFSGSRNGYGVYAPNLPDSSFDTCNASENDLDNWYFGYCTNTRLDNCKGENSGTGAGFHFGGHNVGQTLEANGCTTNLNQGDGFLFDNAGSGFLGTYTLTGCRSSNDNQGLTAGLAGFRSSGCKSRVIGTGCVAVGSNQTYGASEVNGSYGMFFTGSWLTGSSAATHDDASNTHALVNQSPVPF